MKATSLAAALAALIVIDPAGATPVRPFGEPRDLQQVVPNPLVRVQLRGPLCRRVCVQWGRCIRRQRGLATSRAVRCCLKTKLSCVTPR
jgi:hypothetical protein